MVRHKSAVRQHRRSLRRKNVNAQTKSALRTKMRKLREAVQDNDRDGAAQMLPGVFKAIDTFRGDMCDVRLYGRGLGEDEIQRMASGG